MRKTQTPDCAKIRTIIRNDLTHICSHSMVRRRWTHHFVSTFFAHFSPCPKNRFLFSVWRRGNDEVNNRATINMHIDHPSYNTNNNNKMCLMTLCPHNVRHAARQNWTVNCLCALRNDRKFTKFIPLSFSIEVAEKWYVCHQRRNQQCDNLFSQYCLSFAKNQSIIIFLTLVVDWLQLSASHA